MATTGKKRTAGAAVTIGTDEVGCLTGWDFTTEVGETEVSCLSDTVGNPPVIEQTYEPQSVNYTGSVEGMSVFSDAGQSAIEAAADSGAEVTLEFRYYDGSGYDFTGFFTSYNFTGSKDDFAETFTAEMRINSKEPVSAGAS